MNKKKINNILLFGNSIFLDILATILTKENIKYTYVQIENFKTNINFYSPLIISEPVAQKYFLNVTGSILKFSIITDSFVFPVINNLNFFKEVYIKLFPENRDIDEFEVFLKKKNFINLSAEKFIRKNFSSQLFQIISSILLYYNYPELGTLNVKTLKAILLKFFSKNILINKNIPLKFKKETIELQHVEKFKNYLLINKTPYLYDLLISDNFKLMNNHISQNKKFVEFKIKKDYTTEYFPETIIYINKNNFIKIETLKELNNFRFFKVIGTDNISDFLNCFKKFYPLLKKEDFLIIKSGETILNNFSFKGENFSFNFGEKINFIIQEVLKNG